MALARETWQQMQAITFCEFLRFLRDINKIYLFVLRDINKIYLFVLRDINKELFCRLGCKYLSLIEH